MATTYNVPGVGDLTLDQIRQRDPNLAGFVQNTGYADRGIREPEPSNDGGNQQTNLAADGLIADAAAKAAYQAYLDEKMRLIDLPMAEIEKDKLALARLNQEFDHSYKTWSMNFQEAEAARTGDQWLKSFGEQQRQFDQDLGFKEKQLAQVDRQFAASIGLDYDRLQLERDKYGSALSADPNAIVASADFARRSGAARGGNTVIPEAYRTVPPSLGGSQNMLMGEGAGGTINASGTQRYPAAYGALDTRVTLSPEVNAARLGRPVAQFGSPTGTTAYEGTLGDIAATGWNARMLPAAYRNLSETGRQELAAVNQSLTGQRRGELELDIESQLPKQRASLPSAYMNF